MNDKELIAQKLRDLISAVFTVCYGAYGAANGDGYCGQFEREIKALTEAIVTVLEKRTTNTVSIDTDQH